MGDRYWERGRERGGGWEICCYYSEMGWERRDMWKRKRRVLGRRKRRCGKEGEVDEEEVKEEIKRRRRIQRRD